MEPIEFIAINNLPWWLANVIKYTLRYDAKDGLQDLRKARSYLDMKIAQMEGVGRFWEKAVGDERATKAMEYGPPSVTHYTTEEGGTWKDWFSWSGHNGKDRVHTNVFAIKLANGWIWDRLVGWRKDQMTPKAPREPIEPKEVDTLTALAGPFGKPTTEVPTESLDLVEPNWAEVYRKAMEESRKGVAEARWNPKHPYEHDPDVDGWLPRAFS